MASRKRDRRFPVGLPIVKEVRLSLWAYTRGKSKTRMAEDVLIDRVSKADNWDEVCRDLRVEAAIRKIPVENLIKEVLQSDGFDGDIDLEQGNWNCLLEDDSEVDENSEDDE